MLVNKSGRQNRKITRTAENRTEDTFSPVEHVWPRYTVVYCLGFLGKFSRRIPSATNDAASHHG